MGDRVFEPRIHIQRFINTVPEQVRLSVYTVHNDGISSLMDKVKEHSEKFKVANSVMKDKKDKGREKAKEGEQGRQEAILEYEKRKSVTSQQFGDPYSTVFMAHIPIDIAEEEIEKVIRGKMPSNLSKCEVKLIRRGRRAGNYAFITLGNRNEARQCVSNCRKLVVCGRPVVVEVERGRIVKNWLPRRLRRSARG